MSVKKLKDPLTTLLADLPIVRERGFTQSVSYQLQLRLLRRRVIFFTVWCFGFAGIILCLPLESLVAPLLELLQEPNTTWANFANTNQLTQIANELRQASNFSGVVALSAGAILLVLSTFSLIRD